MVAPTDDLILQMRGIIKDFPGVRALDDVTFQVQRGEVMALVGENGAGKSTLMKILSGVYPQYQGEIALDGDVRRFAGTREAEAAGVAIIHQELNLIPGLSVAENIFLGREPTRRLPGIVDWRTMRAEARKLLSRLDLSLDPRTLIRDCSIGQQQMVEIAKALSLNARIIVMDEPTSALTEHEIEQLFTIIRQLHGHGVTVVYISHKIDEIFAIADRVTVLRDGATVGTKPVGEVDHNAVVAMMVGRELTQMYPTRAAEPGRVLLEVEGWSVEDPVKRGAHLVRDISFVVRAGEIVGLAGLMGSGRSELVESLFGAPKGRATGEAKIDGKPLDTRAPSRTIRQGLALVTEDRKRTGLVLGMSVGKNISMASLRELCRMGVINFRAERQLVEKQISGLRLKTPSVQTIINNLSGGNQQKAVVAKWLATEPRVLIVDEPTRGIDVGAKAEIYRIMNDLTAAGIGILMVSSELPEILGMSDRVLVLHEGRLAGDLARAQATQEKVMFLATGGR